MPKPCRVCGGRGTVRLALLSPLEISPSASETIDRTPVETSHDYPCPECSPSAPLDRVAVMEFHCRVEHPPARIARQHEEWMREDMARRLGLGMMKDGYIRYRKFSEFGRPVTRATVGVIAPGQVATLEERISEHQEGLAREVIKEAEMQILVWGSAYTGAEGMISKGLAIDSIRKALEIVLERRASARKR